MYFKTKDGVRINSDFIVQIEELDHTDDGYVECIFKMDNDETLRVEVKPGDLFRLDNGA